MESNVVDCESRGDQCACQGGATLVVLREVQRLYEERLALVDRIGGANQLQNQVEVLRSWVGDLLDQNTLLAQAVEDLEAEATSTLLLERRKNAERDKKRKTPNQSELKTYNDKLQKENLAKDREIRRLNKDAQQYEQTIISLRNELSMNTQYTSNVSKKDAEVMAGMCCTGNECGEWVPVRESSGCVPRDEVARYQERILKMEASLKASSLNVKALRKANVALSEEVSSLRHVCGALHEQYRNVELRTQFKEDIIREMRRQLNHAKTKLRELTESKNTGKKDYGSGDDFPHPSVSYDSVTIACVRQPRPRDHAPYSDDNSPRCSGAGDDCMPMRVDSA